MSAFTLQTVRHWRRLALLAVVLVAVGAMLLVGARPGDTTGAPKPTSTTYTTDASPNPWGANDCAVLVEALGQEAPSTCR